MPISPLLCEARDSRAAHSTQSPVVRSSAWSNLSAKVGQQSTSVEHSACAFRVVSTPTVRACASLDHCCATVAYPEDR
eukprot:12732147-Alexandrium_andersonii.AAC.1